MSTREDVLLAAAATVVLLNNERKTKKRRCWVRSSLLSREKYCGETMVNELIHENTLYGELRDDGNIKNFLRMSSTDIEYLINIVGPKIKKEDTAFRNSISVIERLSITLRFLASGDSYQSLEYIFKVSKQSISSIVPEVCTAITESLKHEIMVSTYLFIY